MGMPSITEFYSGQNIFITGATGFMGKVLVEKLLRSCPDIAKIFVIVRAKKGNTAQERWNELTDLALFDRLKEERPNALSSKVIVLDGDVSNEMLGLKPDDYHLLESVVSIMFHAAASVRFNDPLHEAVKLNTYGTLQAVNLALNMKNLKAFVHVSTAYSNCHINEVEEKIYPPPCDWQEVLKVVEKTNPIELTILTEKYLNKLPNTYVFTKALAESLVWEKRDKLPLIIFRPTIVISAWKEPIPGWIDNFNGPVGLLIGVGKGVIRTMPSDAKAMADFTLVDVAIKSMIVSTWKKATFTNCNNEDFIYNCATTYKNITNEEMVRMGLAAHAEKPLKDILWYPSTTMYTDIKWFRLEAVFKHFLPALIIDSLLKIVGRKGILLKIQVKIHVSMMALSYFLLQRWKFCNDNFLNLIKEIPSADRESFDYDFQDIVPSEYFENAALVGGKRFLLKEKNVNEEKIRRKFLIFKFIHYGLLTTVRLGVLWALYKIYKSYDIEYDS